MEEGSVNPTRRSILIEVVLVYLGTLLAIKGVVFAQRAVGLPRDVLILVPLLFIYVPLLWLRRIKEDPGDYGLVLEKVGAALRFDIILYLIIFPPFILFNHVYQDLLFNRQPQWILPDNLLMDVVLYHLVYVALPEEFFYRGYMQSRLDLVFPRTRTVFGIPLGWGFLITVVLFTVGHTIVQFRWWHFAIAFPALLFGWIRYRTGNVVASTFFHAACNITMALLDTMYGARAP